MYFSCLLLLRVLHHEAALLPAGSPVKSEQRTAAADLAHIAVQLFYIVTLVLCCQPVLGCSDPYGVLSTSAGWKLSGHRCINNSLLQFRC